MARGPRGRFMPGNGGYSVAATYFVDRRGDIEEMFGRRISDAGWYRLNSALLEAKAVPGPDAISFQTWKQRLRKLLKRLKSNEGHGMDPPPGSLDATDIRIIRYAQLHSEAQGSCFDALEEMHTIIAEDEERYKRLKADGTLYEQNDQGRLIHEFCWIEHPHDRTAAVVACHRVMQAEGLDVSLTYRPAMMSDGEGSLIPTAFEKFCFEYIFEISTEEVLAQTKDTHLKDGSFKHFQRVRYCLERQNNLL
ncbi:MAG: hypothetical protein HRU30_00975 [Rhodobacteraceae bacterium]|nr:hypothetical protein [Paracoccaceae bacterium]